MKAITKYNLYEDVYFYHEESNSVKHGKITSVSVDFSCYTGTTIKYLIHFENDSDIVPEIYVSNDEGKLLKSLAHLFYVEKDEEEQPNNE